MSFFYVLSMVLLRAGLHDNTSSSFEGAVAQLPSGVGNV